MAVLAVAAPVSAVQAAVLPFGFPGGGVAQGGQLNAPAACNGPNGPSGIGDAGATENQVCGAALAVLGPSVGQLATAIGPTIIGSTVLAPVVVSNAPVAVISVP